MNSKTNCLFIALLLFCTHELISQNFKFGALAGIGVTNSHITNKPEEIGDALIFYPMISYNFNGYIGYKSARFFGLSLEPGFIQKGGVQTYDKNDKNDNVNIKLFYIQMPLLADFYITDELFVSVGPEFAFLINAKAKSKDQSADINDWYDNTFELSGMVGINYNIFTKFDIGLRYSHGISYSNKLIWTDIEGNVVRESNEYNQYWQFILRFKI